MPRSRAQRIGNARFKVDDVQTAHLGERFNLAFSQFGTMFFANPFAALRNVRRSLAPGGKLVMVAWRSKAENEWLYRAQTITERFLARPQEYDAPTCGPGPFSMADADTTSGMLTAAGFDHISPGDVTCQSRSARTSATQSSFAMSLGPAGEILRLAGERVTHRHGPIAEALHQASPNGTDPTASQAPPRHGSFRRSPQLSARRADRRKTNRSDIVRRSLRSVSDHAGGALLAMITLLSGERRGLALRLRAARLGDASVPGGQHR